MDVDVVVIGAGVVGLACAAALAPHHGVLVIERHTRPGTETSARNSGVIHAGLYYPPGSLKARACVEGRRRLYEYARARGVAHRRTGKLVLAVDPSEEAALGALHARGLENGVEGLSLLDGRELRAREPNLRARLALHVAPSGIVDAHGLMAALAADARTAGALFAWGQPVVGLHADAAGWRVETADAVVRARLVVNAAGLHADEVASLAGLDVDALGWRLDPWKGDYFVVARGPSTTTPLVYPMPVVGGLGVHLTTDLGGARLAGPDAEPCARGAPLDVREDKAAAFAAAVSRYLPGVRADDLRPAYAGVRPKRMSARSTGFADFVLDERPSGLVHLLGVESPGLTAALALGADVAARCRGR